MMRIAGYILVLVVIGVLFVLTSGPTTSQHAPSTSAPIQQNSSDSDFKNLKIQ